MWKNGDKLKIIEANNGRWEVGDIVIYENGKYNPIREIDGFSLAPQNYKFELVDEDLFKKPVKNKKKRKANKKEIQTIVGLEKELSAIITAVKHNFPVLMVGETGCGKTYLISEVAKMMKKYMTRLNLNGDIGINELLGKWLVKDGNTYWQDGPLTQAMRNGDWIVLDEINAALPEVLFCLNSLLDDGKSICLAEKDNEIIAPHKDFRLFATMNPCEDYAGTKELNKALLSRFTIVLDMDYYKPKQELEIIKMHTKIDDDIGSIIIDVANKIREAKSKQITWFTCSTRDIVNWAKVFIANESTLEESFNLSIFNKTSNDEKKELKKYIKDNLGFTVNWSETNRTFKESLYSSKQKELENIQKEIDKLEVEKGKLQKSINEFLPETLESLKRTCSLLEKHKD